MELNALLSLNLAGNLRQGPDEAALATDLNLNMVQFTAPKVRKQTLKRQSQSHRQSIKSKVGTKQRPAQVATFPETYEPNVYDCWTWNADFLRKLSEHGIFHPSKPYGQTVNCHFEFAGGGAPEAACEALSSAGLLQVNIKTQADWDSTKMKALQAQTNSGATPCRFGDIMNIVSSERTASFSFRSETVIVSHLELLEALQLRRCYIVDGKGSDDSDFEERSESELSASKKSDSASASKQSSEQNSSDSESSEQNSSGSESLSESDISIASDINDIKVADADSVKLKIQKLFKGTNLVRSRGEAQKFWELTARVGETWQQCFWSRDGKQINLSSIFFIDFLNFTVYVTQ